MSQPKDLGWAARQVATLLAMAEYRKKNPLPEPTAEQLRIRENDRQRHVERECGDVATMADEDAAYVADTKAWDRERYERDEPGRVTPICQPEPKEKTK